jgi:hypothetical protein
MKTASVGAILIILASGMMPQAASDVVKSLVDTENAFAAMAGQKGIKTAFLSYMDKDAIVFSPKPVRALEHYENDKDQGLLYWVPEFVQISGELAWTTGPWEYREQKMQEKPIATGHFITIWKKQKDRSWNWVLDAGIPHPLDSGVKPVAVDHVVMPAPIVDYIQIGTPKTDKKETEKREIDQIRKLLLSMDCAFTKGAGKTWNNPAYSKEEWARVYRKGSPVIKIREKAFSLLKTTAGEVTFAPMACEVSDSKLLGYTYGMGSFQPADRKSPIEEFSYLHIWECQEDVSWKIVADLTNPIPSK